MNIITNIYIYIYIYIYQRFSEGHLLVKSCNSNLYTNYPGATYSGLLLGTMSCL